MQNQYTKADICKLQRKTNRWLMVIAFLMCAGLMKADKIIKEAEKTKGAHND